MFRKILNKIFGPKEMSLDNLVEIKFFISGPCGGSKLLYENFIVMRNNDIRGIRDVLEKYYAPFGIDKYSKNWKNKNH